ncbi:MAG: glycosyltransferase [Paludibacteraceae bacterium]|nr:glycosyltransferase [Paludibacteraceae bacterium]
MQIVINPKYESLRPWIEQLPNTFAHSGEVIYDARNQIRVIKGADGILYNVKRYHQPRFLNRIIYTLFRAPKAQRAYDNACRLLSLGIDTPTPIAYILTGNLLKDSYLVTIHSSLSRTFYDFRDGNIEGKQTLIEAFAHFSASLHRAGVLHLDYSPGNILYDMVDNQWKFQLVDINRMRFGYVKPKQGCENLCRLWGKHDFFETLSPIYAQDRGISQEQCLRWIEHARARFWKHHAHEHFVTDDTFTVGVVISTYNNPQWLEKVLWGLQCQTHLANEIIIADDGSDERTKQMLQCYQSVLPIKHVWHPDNGFRKTTILNQAIAAATTDYLIFMDQDLIPRRDFISQHYRHARVNRFISGGAIKLPQTTSNACTKEEVVSQRVFQISWLMQHGMSCSWKLSKLCPIPWICWILNKLTPTKATWNGGNASTWRQYLLQVNGFDSRMRYGAEDRELGERLRHIGVRGYQLRYNIPLLHLWHTRPYVNNVDWKMNRQIWNETIKHKLTRTSYGIQQS